MANLNILELHNLRHLIGAHSTIEKKLECYSEQCTDPTLKNMLKKDVIQRYEEDKDVLEDVIIENKQAIEMTDIYSNILGSTMDFFASVISNNFNIVMKVLASVTILMSTLTVISGIYGMNFDYLPLLHHPYGFHIIMTLSVILCGLIAFILYKKDMF